MRLACETLRFFPAVLYAIGLFLRLERLIPVRPFYTYVANVMDWRIFERRHFLMKTSYKADSLLKSFAKTALCVGLFCAAFSPAKAHFQLVYTPEVNLTAAGDVPLKLLFWHPFENGHVMDMAEPEALYAINRGKRIDLKDSLKAIQFTGQSNQGKAYEAVLPVKRSGDYVLVAVPVPYLEASEDLYIQQITKSYVNLRGVPTDWSETQGLKTEIRPLTKPYNVLAGASFTGQVLSEGKPVVGAEIEIEFMAAEPSMTDNKPLDATASPMPGGTVVLLSDDNGMFTFGIPKAGFWGFAALGTGPDKSYDGKELSQDAVLWLRAYDVKKR